MRTCFTLCGTKIYHFVNDHEYSLRPRNVNSSRSRSRSRRGTTSLASLPRSVPRPSTESRKISCVGTVPSQDDEDEHGPDRTRNLTRTTGGSSCQGPFSSFRLSVRSRCQKSGIFSFFLFKIFATQLETRIKQDKVR